MPMHPAETTKVPTTMHDRFNICHAHHSRTEERARVGGGSVGTTGTMLQRVSACLAPRRRAPMSRY